MCLRSSVNMLASVVVAAAVMVQRLKDRVDRISRCKCIPPTSRKPTIHLLPSRPSSSDKPEAITTKVRRPIRGE